MLETIKKLIIEYSPNMSGSASVIIIRMAIDIFENDGNPIHVTQKGYAKKTGFSPSCVKVALYQSQIDGIFKVASDGGVGHMVSFAAGFLD